MWVARATVYSPSTESSDSSRAIRLSEGDLLAILTKLRSADNESDLTLATTLDPGSQTRTATKSAKASHAVLCAGSPTFAPNRRRSCVVIGVAYHEIGR